MGRNFYFLVLDVFPYAGYTQVLLLHLPKEALLIANRYGLKLSQSVLKPKGPDDEPLIQYARRDLQLKMGEPVHGHSLSDEWIERMYQPIGLDKNFNPIDLKPEKTDIKLNFSRSDLKSSLLFSIQCEDIFNKINV